VIVKQIKSEEQMLVMAMIENLQRENLNPLEESFGFKKLRDDYDLVQKDIARIVGKSRTYITNSLRLLRLDKKTKKALENEKITAGHGRALLGIDNTRERHKILKKIIDKGLSVREVEKIVSKRNRVKKTEKKKEQPRDPEIVAIEDKLQEKFGTKVSVNKKKKGGAIKIKFYKDKDLQRIMDILEVSID
jgi:ParB family chromosome partitioning protein